MTIWRHTIRSVATPDVAPLVEEAQDGLEVHERGKIMRGSATQRSIAAVTIIGSLALGTGGSARASTSDDIFSAAAGTLATYEMNGDLADSSGNGRDAARIGGTFEATDRGQGLRISSNAHGLNWNAFAGLLVHPYTVEMVLTPEDTTAWRKVFSFNDAKDAGWYYKAQGIQAFPYAVLGTGTVPPGVERYLAFVSTSPNTLDVYFQGALLGSTNASFTAPPPQAIFFRDDTATGRGEQFTGVVDALRISSVARTASEITRIQERLTGSPPSEPLNVTATAGPGGGEISVAWDAPAVSDVPITDYRIYRGTEDGAEIALTTVSAENRSFTDVGLGNGATLFYRVRALNAAGEGPLSTSASATTFSPPGAPTNLSASVGPAIGGTTLSWGAPTSDGGAPVTGYRVYRGTLLVDEGLVAEVGNVLTYVDGTCPLGELCFWRLSAVNAAGEGPLSNGAVWPGTAIP